MSEEESRRQRAELLLSLDEQKRLVADLTERHARTKDLLHQLQRLFEFDSSRIALTDDGAIINDKPYDRALVELSALVANRQEYLDARKRLSELQARAKSLGISLA